MRPFLLLTATKSAVAVNNRSVVAELVVDEDRSASDIVKGEVVCVSLSVSISASTTCSLRVL